MGFAGHRSSSSSFAMRVLLREKKICGPNAVIQGWIYRIMGASIIINGRQQRSYRPYRVCRRCAAQVASQRYLILHNGIA
jgi:hypothetical protein